MEKHNIFISYAREDNKEAERLYNELNNHPSVAIWIDKESLLAGSYWKDEILKKIETSDFILIILSNKSISKEGFFQREMREALERLSYLPPGKRVIIPIRLEACKPLHRELRLLNYLDMYPDWENGIKLLYKSIGILQYTHTYRVSGSGIFGYAYLTPIKEDSDAENDSNAAFVNIDTLPEIDLDRIPNKPLKRVGGAHSILVELWSIAQTKYDCEFYIKGDWMTLEQLLYNERTDEDKEKLKEVIIRQWAYAQEQKSIYRQESWQALHRLIQDYKPWPL